MEGIGAAPFAIEGELTIGSARERKAELLNALEAGSRVVDLRGVTHIDGAGLQLLLLLRREADLRGLRFDGVLPSRAVQLALDMARVDLCLSPVPQARPGLTEAA
ncbi:STAS domain-containing protein [Lysobacter xanthus]